MSELQRHAPQIRIRASHDSMRPSLILKTLLIGTATRHVCRNGERTPLPGQLRVSGRQGCVRSQYPRSLILVLSDDAEQAVLFVRDSSGEENSSSLRGEHIPQAVKLERRSVGAHQCLDKGARDRIVDVNESVSKITDPEPVFRQSKSPWGIEIPV